MHASPFYKSKLISVICTRHIRDNNVKKADVAKLLMLSLYIIRMKLNT